MRGNWRGVQAPATVAGRDLRSARVVTDPNGIVVADTARGTGRQRFTGERRLAVEPRSTSGAARRRVASASGAGRPAARGRFGSCNGRGGATYGTLYVESSNAAVAARDRAFLARLRGSPSSARYRPSGALAVSVLLARRIGRPLETLTARRRRMGTGDLDQRVPEEGGARVAELARCFNAMATNLATAQQLRQQLVADVAHELRTPLANIRGYLEAIEDGIVPADEATLRTLREEAAQLNHLIDDLQELAQAEAGVLRLDRGPVAPDELVERAAEAARARALPSNVLPLPPARPPTCRPVTLTRSASCKYCTTSSIMH